MLDKMLFLATQGSEMDLMSMFGMFAAFLAFLQVFIWVAIILSIAIYVYTSLALYNIGKKLNYSNPWLAWIPVANIAMILQLGDFHWALVFLLLIPIFGWLAIAILGIIAFWKICVKRNYPGWLSLIGLGTIIPIIGFLAVIAQLIILGLVAWKDK